MKFRKTLSCVGLTTLFLFAGAAFAATTTANTEAELRSQINAAQPGDSIWVGQNISLTGTITGGAGSGFMLDSTSISQEVRGPEVKGNGTFGLIDMTGKDITSIRDIQLSSGVNLNGGGAYSGRSIIGPSTSDGSALWNAVFQNNTNTGGTGGGAIYLTGNLQVGAPSPNVGQSAAIDFGTTFKNNTATAGSGGALYVGGEFIGGAFGSRFESNTAGKHGGAIYADKITSGVMSGYGGNSFMTGLHFTQNSAGGDGGAIYAKTMGAEVYNDTQSGFHFVDFDRNHADGNGGAIHIGTMNGVVFSPFPYGGDDNPNHSGFRRNTAGGNGGAIDFGDMNNMLNGYFFENEAGGNGGAINVSGTFNGAILGGMADKVYPTWYAPIFTGNKAGKSGGAVWGNPLEISNATFTKNIAGEDGGAVYNPGGQPVSLIASDTFTGNEAGRNGGGVYYAKGNGDIYVTNTAFDSNKATSKGGGMYLGTDENNTKYNLTLTATDGKTTSFTNNTQDDGKNSFYAGGAGTGAEIQVRTSTPLLPGSGNGKVILTDPFATQLGDNNKFTMTHDSPNLELVMSGKNNVGVGDGSTIKFDFLNGKTRLTRDTGDFQVVADDGAGGNTNSNFALTWGANHTLTIEGMDSRPGNLPFFDATKVTGNKTFTIENGTTMDITRVLKPLPNQRFLLVDGLTAGAASHPDQQTVTEVKFLHPDGYTLTPMFEKNGTQFWLDGLDRIPDAFDPGATVENVVSGETGITNWLNNTPEGLSLSPEQVIALRRDMASMTSEAVLDMVLIGMDVHASTLRAARMGFIEHSPGNYCPPDPCQPDPCLPSRRFRVWANYVGGIDDARSTNAHSGYKTHTNGGLVGAVFEMSPAFALGGYFGYSRSTVDFKDLSADGDLDGIHTGVQAAVMTPFGLRIIADGSYSHNSVDVSRRPGDLADISSDFSQKVYGAGLEIAWPFMVTELTRLTPSASFDATWIRQGAVTESGEFMAIAMDKVNGHRLVSRVGAVAEHDFMIANGSITPGFGAYWKHRFSGKEFDAEYAFLDNLEAGHTGRDLVRSREQKADSLELSAYIDAALLAGRLDWSFRAGYTADISHKQVNHTFYGGIGVSF